MDVKVAGVNRKGYRREHLHDPWTRYLPPLGGDGATSATTATEQVNEGRSEERRVGKECQ